MILSRSINVVADGCFNLVLYIIIEPLFIKNHIFGSIVVSISACHSKEQLAGGRGSIPRQRDMFLLPFFVAGSCVRWPERCKFCRLRLEFSVGSLKGLAQNRCLSANTDRATFHSTRAAGQLPIQAGL